jgi:hypothetical protein
MVMARIKDRNKEPFRTAVLVLCETERGEFVNVCFKVKRIAEVGGAVAYFIVESWLDRV